jgi:hypothetical protein
MRQPDRNENHIFLWDRAWIVGAIQHVSLAFQSTEYDSSPVFAVKTNVRLAKLHCTKQSWACASYRKFMQCILCVSKTALRVPKLSC